MPLYLRDTTYAGGTNLGTTLSYGQLDGNFVFLDQKLDAITGSLITTGSSTAVQSITGSLIVSQSSVKLLTTLAVGEHATVTGDYGVALNLNNYPDGDYSFAHGNGNVASGIGAHAEGQSTYATAPYAHSEGQSTVAGGSFSHAEGHDGGAIGAYAHSEGAVAYAYGNYSHAEGYATYTYGDYSHTEGSSTVTSGSFSHAEGIGTIASGSGQHVTGKYNKRGNDTSLFVIGNGTSNSDANRSDIVRVETTAVQITGSLIVSGSGSNGFVILANVSASLNFVDDAAAASGGVPLGGLYRSGSIIVIRIS